MRLGVGVEVKTLRLDLIDGVRRRGFNPVHLLRQQRRGMGVGLGKGSAPLYPPGECDLCSSSRGFIEDQLLTRHQLLQFERAATHRVGGEGGPRLFAASAALSPTLAGTASYCFCHAVGETINRLVMLYGSSASGSGGGQRHGVVVNFLRR